MMFRGGAVFSRPRLLAIILLDMSQGTRWTLRETLGGQKAQFKQALDLVVKYVKQETLGPLRSIGKFLGLGIGGAILVSIGFLLVLLGILRLLQTETGATFHDHLSWLPYLITVFIGSAMTVLSFSLALKRRRR